ncbi:DNA-directed RNA polymerase I subunit RPA1 [Nematocida homosporus]|uniref:DNA-directed RNA polymerase I subunit RPA1 n=1 Tax=Nematocida homosporus TaxID=1912981 RepID=UPI00221FA967|nr:DNA-directed RNA polymerase I subunit RPA1 [Nematocida homosporus]KAI5187064.1 DNA-directed RNA polymerase I subunit RPA1 [Nematocida homosporus]
MLFEPTKVLISALCPEEIRKESVVPIRDGGDFDELGHPIENSVYDLRLGATKEANCRTCGLGLRGCPGHLGHIDLPLPLYNPMHYDMLCRLLGRMCWGCKRFKMGRLASRGYSLQIAAVERSREDLVEEIKLAIKSEDEEKLQEVSTLLQEEWIKQVDGEEGSKMQCRKETELGRSRAAGLRKKVLREILSQQLRHCMWCGSRSKTVTLGPLRILVEGYSAVKGGSVSSSGGSGGGDVVEGNGDVSSNVVEGKLSGKKNSLLLPVEAVGLVQELSKNEMELLQRLFPLAYEKKPNENFLLPVFFLEILAVTPIGFRPIDITMSGTKTHAKRTVLYQKIVGLCQQIFCAEYTTETSQITSSYLALQDAVGMLYNEPVKGHQSVKEVIEKKEGLFRKHIMGKRVNYTARSVISPDPALGVDEIGVPEVFAQKLTFPEPVSALNAQALKAAIENGPVYPGAEYVEDASGRLTSLRYLSEAQRSHLARQILAHVGPSSHAVASLMDESLTVEPEAPTKRVWRHMRTGDYVLVNRQPSLHKVSMMGHRVKVLPSSKTLRLHYVNCNSYNADFDGDEMNVHFPQDIVAQVEAAEICSTNQCYASATNGNPVRGHVQDHVVMGSLVSQSGVFIDPEEFGQLVVAALSSKQSAGLSLPTPTILRPRPLFTGAQAISTVVQNLGTRPTFTGQSRLGDEVRFKEGELLTGSLDKSQIGTTAYGLVHSVAETYGGQMANRLLTALGQLFNRALISMGFSCTMDDLMVAETAEKEREEAVLCGGVKGAAEAEAFYQTRPNYVLDTYMAVTQGEVPDVKRLLDSAVGEVASGTASVALEAVSSGLVRSSLRNRMYLMVASGAKGSLVNLGQIISMLGQQELEGMRVPIMCTGRTLPTFMPNETAMRSAGFISQRFLTGVHPEEFYFHCMAGREGLIDTAVKTSRSGYLQRCLIKHLEGVVVAVDGSVCDSDGSVLQMVYGDDGTHPERTAYLDKVVNGDFSSLPAASSKPGVVSDAIQLFENENVSNSQKSDGLDLYNLRTKPSLLPPRYLSSTQERPSMDTWLKYVVRGAEPGEPVGILAAQSVGEPSTQMTLNTFHLAGVGGKNVTLGMPRLSEIVMTASRVIKTPIITASPLSTLDPEVIKELQRGGRKRIVDVIESIRVVTEDELGDMPQRIVKVRIEPRPGYEQSVLGGLADGFFQRFAREMKAVAKTLADQAIEEINTPTTPTTTPSTETKSAATSGGTDSESESDGEESSSQSSSSDISESEASATPTQAPEEESQDKIEEDLLADESPTPSLQYNDIGQNIRHQDPTDGPLIAQSEDGKFIDMILTAPIIYQTLYLPRIEAILKKMFIQSRTFYESCTYSNSQFIFEGCSLRSLLEAAARPEIAEVIDIRTARSNSIWEVLETLGVEAARVAIIREIEAVFSVYGITIDKRHLSVIADYMTYSGTIVSFNRVAFQSKGSLFQKISYETAYTFIKTASIFSEEDPLMNPSSCIAIGKPVEIGTNQSGLGYAI